MSLVDEYYDRSNNPPKEPAKKILFDVIDNIRDRRDCDFFGDLDDEIQEEFLQTNLEIIRKHLS